MSADLDKLRADLNEIDGRIARARRRFRYQWLATMVVCLGGVVIAYFEEDSGAATLSIPHEWMPWIVGALSIPIFILVGYITATKYAIWKWQIERGNLSAKILDVIDAADGAE